jgi:Xaa-Pro aminopeptidase
MIANRSRAAEIMEREGLQALVATTPENLYYTVEVPVRFTDWTIQMYAVMPRDPAERCALVIPTVRLGTIAQEGEVDADLYLYGTFFVEGSTAAGESTEDLDRFGRWLEKHRTIHPDPLTALKAALADRGLASAPIGVDEMRIAPHLFARLQDELTAEKVRPAFKLFRQIRLVKTPEEIERLRQAAAIAERAEWAVTEMVAPGVHERDLAQCYRLSITKDGGTPKNVTIGTGPRSAIPTIQRYFSTVK